MHVQGAPPARDSINFLTLAPYVAFSSFTCHRTSHTGNCSGDQEAFLDGEHLSPRRTPGCGPEYPAAPAAARGALAGRPANPHVGTSAIGGKQYCPPHGIVAG